MAENTPKLYPSLPDDSSTSEDEPVPDNLKTTIEEKTLGTITAVAVVTTVLVCICNKLVNSKWDVFVFY